MHVQNSHLATSNLSFSVSLTQKCTVTACCRKVKVKVVFLYSATYMVDQEQRALTISEMAVDWQEPVVMQRKCGHRLSVLTDIGPAVAASRGAFAQRS